MAWVRIDDTFHDDPDVLCLPLESVGLLVLSQCWSNRHLQDGWVSDDFLRGRLQGGGKNALKQLRLTGWIQRRRKDGRPGWQISQKLAELQQSRDEVLTQRAANRERQKNHRDATVIKGPLALLPRKSGGQ
jgi:hypothetical protein